jgi:hypothetical protein
MLGFFLGTGLSSTHNYTATAIVVAALVAGFNALRKHTHTCTLPGTLMSLADTCGACPMYHEPDQEITQMSVPAMKLHHPFSTQPCPAPNGACLPVLWRVEDKYSAASLARLRDEGKPPPDMSSAMPFIPALHQVMRNTPFMWGHGREGDICSRHHHHGCCPHVMRMPSWAPCARSRHRQ